MEKVTVRHLQFRDASQVALLIPQLTKNIVQPEKLQERIESLVESKNYQYFVAEKDDKVIGFAGLAWYPIPSKGLMGWIEEVVVDESCRGQGVAPMLIDELLKLAEEMKLVQVKLTTANGGAKRLYENKGFFDKYEGLMVKKFYPKSV